MITVIIEGTKDIHNTLKSLMANAKDDFRVLVDGSVRKELIKIFEIEFVEPGWFSKYGPKSDFYWVLPSGCLVLCAGWDYRIELAKRKGATYCLHPSGNSRHLITNSQKNVGRWKGAKYPVPILSVTEA